MLLTVGLGQAYILSAVQEAPTSAHNKVDDLRKTAAVQTAMGMAYSLTSTVTSLGSKANITLPESVTESVSKYVYRMDQFFNYCHVQIHMDRVTHHFAIHGLLSTIAKLQQYYQGLRAGDDKLAVSNTLRQLTDDTLRVWEQIKGSVTTLALVCAA